MDKCAPGSLDEIVSDEVAIGLLALGESDNYDDAVIIQGQGVASFVVFVLIGRKRLLPSPASLERIQNIVQMTCQFWVEPQSMPPALFSHVYLVAMPVSYHPLSAGIEQSDHSFSGWARCGVFNHTSKHTFCQKDDREAHKRLTKSANSFCMTQTDSSQLTILVAVPDEWREVLAQFLKREGFSVLLATSLDEASSIIHSQSLSAVVMISDWAIASDEGKTDGLMKIVKGKIPTVSLITPRTWRDARSRWFDELYHPPLHEYCSIPVDIEQLSRRLSKAIEEAVNI